MIRRLLVQFGVAALGLVLTSGMAFAANTPDSTPAPGSNAVQPPINQQGSANTSSSTGSEIISTTSSTNQVIGPSSDNDSTTTNPPASGAGSGASSPTNSTTQPSLSGGGSAPQAQDSSTSSQAPSEPPAAQPPSVGGAAGTPLQSGNGDTSQGITSGLNQPISIATAIRQAAAVVASHPTNRQELVATTAPSLPQSSAPGLPHTPVGFLAQLPLLMTQVIVPLFPHLPLATFPIALTAALLTVSVLLVLAIAELPMSTYTARLRRSGFLGAARSDVGVADFSFATPREMSFICVYAP